MTTHKQVNVNGIDVDEGMAELLRMVWGRGIRTQFSCQSDGGQAMIVFPTVDDALKFMRGTFDVTGYYGCYTDRLVLRMGAPIEGPVRAIVRWGRDFTQVWEAAWRNEPLTLDDALEIFSPGYKAECDRLDAEEITS